MSTNLFDRINCVLERKISLKRSLVLCGGQSALSSVPLSSLLSLPTKLSHTNAKTTREVKSLKTMNSTLHCSSSIHEVGNGRSERKGIFIPSRLSGFFTSRSHSVSGFGRMSIPVPKFSRNMVLWAQFQHRLMAEVERDALLQEHLEILHSCLNRDTPTAGVFRALIHSIRSVSHGVVYSWRFAVRTKDSVERGLNDVVIPRLVRRIEMVASPLSKGVWSGYHGVSWILERSLVKRTRAAVNRVWKGTGMSEFVSDVGKDDGASEYIESYKNAQYSPDTPDSSNDGENDDNTIMSRESQFPEVTETALMIIPQRSSKGLIQSLRSSWNRFLHTVMHSENPIVRFPRAVAFSMRDLFQSLLGRFFQETEESVVFGEIRNKEPGFNLYYFMDYLERDMIPKVLQAFRKGDLKYLKNVCSEPAFYALSSVIRQREQDGVVLDPRVLDVRGLQFLSARFVNDHATLLITFSSQHIDVERSKRTHRIVKGSPDNVQQHQYVWALRHRPGVKEVKWELLEMFLQQATSHF
eukprot:TRINITY_DN1101_c0_g1_i3.p1 TRINITY_DN1101_c0_g1~~TRINITY_DN1101_c0_g1_i3.p1  ORF type:complete len:524 (-),score=131.70 TRINITY_DN1101_c0_g1_i3:113-1684(-)